MSTNNQIDTYGGSIICTGKNIGISDDRLEIVLSRTYETARKDAAKKSFWGYYSVAFSIAGTLFVSLLTSRFNDLGPIPASWVTVGAWIIFVICFLGGIIMISVNTSKKDTDMITERNVAVKNELDVIRESNNPIT